MKKLVKVVALVSGVTTVRGDRVMQNIVTEADAQAAAAAEAAGEQNTHTFFVTPSIAEQLRKLGVAKIVGEGEASAKVDDEPMGKRVAAHVDADLDGGDRTSGLDTRDTTAFAKPPLAGGERAEPVAEDDGEEGDEGDDAPPTEDEDDADDAAPATPTKPAKAATRKRPPRKPVAGKS